MTVRRAYRYVIMSFGVEMSVEVFSALGNGCTMTKGEGSVFG